MPPAVDCDVAAITNALSEAPEPQVLDGTPACSKMYWVIPVITPSTQEALTVVFAATDDALEPIAVVARSECADLAGVEPEFNPRLCPA